MNKFAIGDQVVCVTEHTAMNDVASTAIGVPLRVEGFFRADGQLEAWEVRSGRVRSSLRWEPPPYRSPAGRRSVRRPAWACSEQNRWLEKKRAATRRVRRSF